MVFFVLAIIAGVLIGIYVGDYHDSVILGIMIGLIGVIFSAIIALFLWIGASVLFKNTISAYEEVKSYEITAMQGSSQTTESVGKTIFLSTGTIDEKVYYFFLRETPSGIVFSKSLVSKTFVIFTKEGEVPRVEYKQKLYNNPAWIWLVIPYEGATTTVYIPKGSIAT